MTVYQIDRPGTKRGGAFVPSVPRALVPAADDEDLFSLIRRRTCCFTTVRFFQPVVDLLRKAAHDPEVLAIKMVLSASAGMRPVVEALLEAMEEGKQFACFLEFC